MDALNCTIDDEIELRGLDESMAEEIFALTDGNRAHLREWLPWLDATATVEDTRAFLAGELKRRGEDLGFGSAILIEGKIVGVIALHDIDWAAKTVPIGYWLAKSAQGRGIITRACRALVDFVFQEIGLDSIEIHCAVGNTKSRAIPPRLGFKADEEVHKNSAELYGRLVDEIFYRMTRDEWRAQSSD